MAIDPSPLSAHTSAPPSYRYPESASIGAVYDTDDDHVAKTAPVSGGAAASRPTPFLTQGNTSTPPMVSRSSSSNSSSLKRKLQHCSSLIPEAVPEEESLSTYNGDDDTTESDETSSSETSSSQSSTAVNTVDRGSTISSAALLHHEPERLIVERLEEVKRMHEQDKEFFTREIRNLRMVLFEIDATLKDRTSELEFILKERETERLEWEVAKLEMGRQAEAEKEELRAMNRILSQELEGKKREYGGAMDVLEGTHQELLGVAMEDLKRSRRTSSQSSGSGKDDSEGEATKSSRRNSSDSESSAAEDPPSTLSAFSRYAGIPERVSSLRKRLVKDEERFQAAYNAWSSESKHQRKVHQKQLKSLNSELQRKKEEVKKLSEENKKLASQLEGSRYDAVVARRETQIARTSTRRRSQEIQTPSSASGLPPTQDRISLEEAVKRVQKLNMRIVETASVLTRHLQAAKEENTSKKTDSSSTTTNSIREAIWLLGGESVTSQLTFIPPPSKSKSNALLVTLLQIALTTWSAHHVHSWDLHAKTAWSGENPLVAVYRKLAIVEDPGVAAAWRSLTRAQLKFSSTAWTQALISSMHNVLSFLGLAYARPVTAMAKELEPLLQSLRSVREAVGELVVGKDLEIATVDARTRFDFRYMKDAFPNGFSRTGSPLARTSSSRGKKPERVAVPCGLGLKAIDGVEGERLLALPHVLREASLNDLLGSI